MNHSFQYPEPTAPALHSRLRHSLFSTARWATLALAGMWGAGASAQAQTVAVDFSQPGAPAKQVASSFLHGVSAVAPSSYLVDGVTIKFLRGADHHPILPSLFDARTYERVKATGAQLMVGTYYYIGDRRSPYFNQWPGVRGDYDTYKRIVTGVLQEGKDKGIPVYSWITWNEPDIQFRTGGRNFEQFLNTHKAGYDAIKAFNPSYRVQAPEMAAFDRRLMHQFLLFCKQNNCLPDVLSWHELTNDPLNVEAHTAEIRKFMVDNGIQPMPMSVTEYQAISYGTPEAYNVGENVSWLARFERSAANGLESALYSAWNYTGADPRFVAGLGNATNTQGTLPRAVWWNYNAYRDMTGQMLRVTPSNATLDAMGAVDNSLHRSVLLVGNQAAVPTPVTLALRGLARSPLVDNGRVHVRAVLITNGDVLTQPSNLFEGDVDVVNGQAQVALPNLPAHASYRIDLRPSIAYKPTKLGFEAEILRPAEATAGYRTFAEVGASGTGAGVLLATAPGAHVSFALTVPSEGVYNLRSRLKREWTRGIGQLYVNGKPVSFPRDQFGAFNYHWTDFGNVALKTGTNEFKFVAVAKNPQSSNFYLGFDRFELTRLD